VRGALLCPVKYKRYFVKSREARAVLSGTSGSFGALVEQVITGKTGLEVVEADFGKVFLVNGQPLLFEHDARIFPTLMFEKFLAGAARIVVDMGAVAHVCNGADVMAPGIVRYEGNFGKGDFVVVIDVHHGKPLLIGEALVDSGFAKNMTSGVVVKNIHFVGDKVWSFLREFVGTGL
jgi:PUA-domain protein